MVADDPLQLSPAEQRHHEVMRSVVAEVQDTPYVLKGGTALLLCRELPRHSTDLDFDSHRKVNIERRIRDGMKKAGVELLGITRVKDTDTTQRFKAHYSDPVSGEDTLLKVETSFRDAPDPADVEVVNGIRTYVLPRIYDQKITAAQERTAPRDLFDLAHLTRRYADQLSNEQIFKAEMLTDDLDGLRDRFHTPFDEDPVVARSSSAEDTVLIFRDAVDVESDRRIKQRQFRDPMAMLADAEAMAARSALADAQAQLADAQRASEIAHQRLSGERDLHTGRLLSFPIGVLPPATGKSSQEEETGVLTPPQPDIKHYERYSLGEDIFRADMEAWARTVEEEAHSERQKILIDWYDKMPERRESLHEGTVAGGAFSALKSDVSEASSSLGLDSNTARMMDAERLDLIALHPQAHDAWVSHLETQSAEVRTEILQVQEATQTALRAIDERIAGAVRSATSSGSPEPSR